MRRHIGDVLEGRLAADDPDLTGTRAIATSQTFRQLTRLAGTKIGRNEWVLTRTGLRDRLRLLTAMTARDRAHLPGIKRSRARQILAGALVAEQVMKRCGLHELQVCPWGLRGGIALSRLAWLSGTCATAADMDGVADMADREGREGRAGGPLDLVRLAGTLADDLPPHPSPARRRAVVFPARAG